MLLSFSARTFAPRMFLPIFGKRKGFITNPCSYILAEIEDLSSTQFAILACLIHWEELRQALVSCSLSEQQMGNLVAELREKSPSLRGTLEELALSLPDPAPINAVRTSKKKRWYEATTYPY